MELCSRKDVPVEQTWDLSLIFPEEKMMWEALEKAVNGLNDGRGTLADIVKEFCLEEWRPGRYMEPRWGWPIEYDPEVGYYLCY